MIPPRLQCHLGISAMLWQPVQWLRSLVLSKTQTWQDKGRAGCPTCRQGDRFYETFCYLAYVFVFCCIGNHSLFFNERISRFPMTSSIQTPWPTLAALYSPLRCPPAPCPHPGHSPPLQTAKRRPIVTRSTHPLLTSASLLPGLRLVIRERIVGL